jgi:hypothetical protein
VSLLPRRRLLASLGLAGGAVALGAGRGLASGTSPTTAPAHDHGPTPASEHLAAHGSLGTIGRVDHVRNGFDPHEILTDFDGGTVSKDAAGRPFR